MAVKWEFIEVPRSGIKWVTYQWHISGIKVRFWRNLSDILEIVKSLQHLQIGDMRAVKLYSDGIL